LTRDVAAAGELMVMVGGAALGTPGTLIVVVIHSVGGL
jgi:hypothetical protein